VIPISDGGRPRGSFPVVNVVLLGLNALVFLYEIAIGGFGFLFGADSVGIVTFFYKFGFIPSELSSGAAYQVLLSESGLQLSIASPIPTWATILTSMFIHGGLMHFIGNMLFLWVFGDNIEDTFGHVKYLVFYLVAGVLATLAHYVTDTGSQTPLVGASGAISGVLGAYLVLYPRNRIRTLIVYFLITVVELRAAWLLLIWIGLQVVQGLLSIGISNQVSTAFFAHIGGFVFGAGIIILYRLATRQPIWPPRYSLAPPSSQFWRGRPLD
jgi:membrane associated rhomboid family serine protease